MVMGLIIPGIALGATLAVLALFTGYGVLWAIGLYAAGGMAGTLLSAGLMLLRSQPRPATIRAKPEQRSLQGAKSLDGAQ